MSEETKEVLAADAAVPTQQSEQVPAAAEPAQTQETTGTAEENQLPPPPAEIPVQEEPTPDQVPQAEAVPEPAAEAASSNEQAEQPAPKAEVAEPAKPQQQKKRIPGDEDIAKAVEVIKRTGAATSICLERELKVHWRWAVKLIAELERRGLIGPKEGPKPRTINFELNPGVEPKKPAATVKAEKAKKPAVAKPAKKDLSGLKTEWADKLKKVGGFTDEGFVSAAVHYAAVTHGYSINHKWGSVLITMVCRLAFHLRDRIERFSLADAEFIQKGVLSFLNDKPLGESVIEWNDPEQFANNDAQRQEVLDYWNLRDRRFDQLSEPEQALKMVVDSVYPTEFEAEKLVGGTFAERLHYLLFFVVKVITTYENFEQVFWGPMLHEEPTPEWRRRSLERRGIQVDESWIEDGKCSVCGSDVVLNKHGVRVCSNKFCEKSMIVVDTRKTADGFRNGRTTPAGRGAPQQRDFGDAPQRRDHDRRERDDDDDRHFSRKRGKPKGSRHFRGEGDEFDRGSGSSNGEPVNWSSGEMPPNNPFGSLS